MATTTTDAVKEADSTSSKSSSGTSAPTPGAPMPDRSHPRPPSLNQLAARMNIAAANAGTTAALPRPRLAAGLLRTGSTTSVNTAASTNDSVAVNAPSTRAGSNVSAQSSRATSPIPPVGQSITPTDNQGEPLTQEKLEKHDEMESTGQLNKTGAPMPRGYKNVPSLEIITARMRMTRSLSIDGTPQPPEPEVIEDPKTPGLFHKAPEHPLQHKWTIHYDTKSRHAPTPNNSAGNFPDKAAQTAPAPVEMDEYEAGLITIGDFDTVESFCRYFNWLKPPSKLERNSNYHLFKKGIKPMWEDPANANGGKWVLTMRNNPQLLDRCWSWLTMGLVGDDLDGADDICGAVVSLRTKVDRIQLWVKIKDDIEKVNGIGRRLVKLLDVSDADGIGLEFQYNSDDRPPPNKYLTIQASFPHSGFRSSFQPGQQQAQAPAPNTNGPTQGTGGGVPLGVGGGAFAGFSGGAFGTSWRNTAKKG